MRTCTRFTFILAFVGTTSGRAIASDASIDAFSIRHESSDTARTFVVARERRGDARDPAVEAVGALGGSDGAMDAFELRRIPSRWGPASAHQPGRGAGLAAAVGPLGASDGAYDTFAIRANAHHLAAYDDAHGVISHDDEGPAADPGDARDVDVESAGLGSGDR